jgi:leucyl aminopeptidase
MRYNCSGGLNLKPTNSIEGMYMDMSGAAAVLAAMKSVAILKPNVNIVAALAMAENAIDSLSVKPHTILHSKKGTVLIGNTDAEGRLALADCFSYIQESYSPARVIDLATLTGACVVALGEYTAGLFSNSDELAGQLFTAGQRVHERVWRLPIEPEAAEELKSNFADIKSIGNGKGGGACSAAAFLEKYVESNVAWAHVDIAGPAMYSKQREYMPENGTGFGVQLLLEFIHNLALPTKAS